MTLNSLFCANVPLRNYSLTHSPVVCVIVLLLCYYCLWCYFSSFNCR